MTRLSLLTGITAFSAFSSAALAANAAPESKSLVPLSLADGWLGERRTPHELKNRVVLVDVFTFECINCVDVTPNLKKLYGKYERLDLEIVAVHTPEVPSYQSRIAYLAAQKRAAAIPWPIAIDNRSRIWNAYGVSAWPTQLLFDRSGRLVRTFVGEGQDDDLDAAIARLVR